MTLSNAQNRIAFNEFAIGTYAGEEGHTFGVDSCLREMFPSVKGAEFGRLCSSVFDRWVNGGYVKLSRGRYVLTAKGYDWRQAFVAKARR